MNGFALFTDVSVNPQRKLGVGGYLLVPVSFLENEPHDIEQGAVSARLKFKRFAETSSSRLEVQTVLWALDELREVLSGSAPGSLWMYTDSQCVAGLMGRRAGLINRDFAVRRSGRELAHAPLYRAFYAAYDQFGFRLVKVPAHTRASDHDTVQRIFSYVDREVRKALALWMGENQSTLVCS
jgi:ribonuclease HI